MQRNFYIAKIAELRYSKSNMVYSSLWSKISIEQQSSLPTKMVISLWSVIVLFPIEFMIDISYWNITDWWNWSWRLQARHLKTTVWI